jgi:hypothetical protein
MAESYLSSAPPPRVTWSRACGPDDLRRYAATGADAVLVGEGLVTTASPLTPRPRWWRPVAERTGRGPGGAGRRATLSV